MNLDDPAWIAADRAHSLLFIKVQNGIIHQLSMELQVEVSPGRISERNRAIDCSVHNGRGRSDKIIER